MNFKSTLIGFRWCIAIIVASMLTMNATAQSAGCANEKVIWLETFGQGTTVTSHPDVTSLTYVASGTLEAESTYRIANNTQQKPEWHASTDHTGDADGKMLVANGEAETFFQHVVSSTVASGFAEGYYSVSLYVMNINTPGTCSPNPLLPHIQIIVEYLDASNAWVPLANSPFAGPALPQTTTPVWVNVTGYFSLPSLGTFAPDKIKISISDGTVGGCGNDFAADDIKFSLCPEGAPTPVTFMDITAKQKGSGVSVDWGTSQEINNDHFEVERSADGNSGWSTVSSVAGAGNSQVQHNYNVFDANPISGNNYYRVKQVDKDGKSTFSKTVSARVDNVGTRVSVVGNPFRNNFVVKFNGASQEVNARLMDITGKQVARETWSISNGETSKQFGNVSGLQSGIYILTVHNKTGEVLFNGKVLKQ